MNALKMETDKNQRKWVISDLMRYAINVFFFKYE